MDKSQNLILFGFAFNQYDKALLEFLKVKGKNIARIFLIDPFPNINAAKKLWPDAIINTIDPRNEFDLSKHLSK